MLSYPISKIHVGDMVQYYLADFPELPSVAVDPNIDTNQHWIDKLREDAIVILQNRIRLNQTLPYPSCENTEHRLHFSTTVQFKLAVYTEMQVRHMRKGYLSQLCGSSPRATSDILNLRVPTRLETLERVLQAMGVEVTVKLVPLDNVT